MLARIKTFFLSLLQDSLIFKTHPKNVEPIKNPDEYGLANTVNVALNTEDGETINLWVRQPEKDSGKIYIMFHGNTGNLGDVGKGEADEEFFRDYRIRLLKAIAKKGDGYIAVSHRGYGLSTGKPSEAGFLIDISAIVNFVKSEGYQNISVIGESLGAFSCLATMDELTKNAMPPLTASVIAAFSNLREKVVELHPDLVNQKLENYLRHKLDSQEILATTQYQGPINLFHSRKDDISAFFHSEKLLEAGRNNNLNIKLHDITPSGHVTWDPAKILKIIDENE